MLAHHGSLLRLPSLQFPTAGVVGKAGLGKGYINICSAITQLGAGTLPSAGAFATLEKAQLGLGTGFGTLHCASADSQCPYSNCSTD